MSKKYIGIKIEDIVAGYFLADLTHDQVNALLSWPEESIENQQHRIVILYCMNILKSENCTREFIILNKHNY